VVPRPSAVNEGVLAGAHGLDSLQHEVVGPVVGALPLGARRCPRGGQRPGERGRATWGSGRHSPAKGRGRKGGASRKAESAHRALPHFPPTHVSIQHTSHGHSNALEPT